MRKIFLTSLLLVVIPVAQPLFAKQKQSTPAHRSTHKHHHQISRRLLPPPAK